MIIFLNKIFVYFGYIIISNKDIEQYIFDKDSLTKSLLDKDKDILILEQSLDNHKGIIEEYNYELINLKTKYKKRYKEINRLRSNIKGLTESRDNYKDKYKKLCGKLALKNIRK